MVLHSIIVWQLQNALADKQSATLGSHAYLLSANLLIISVIWML